MISLQVETGRGKGLKSKCVYIIFIALKLLNRWGSQTQNSVVVLTQNETKQNRTTQNGKTIDTS
jgi:hypothetical protein